MLAVRLVWGRSKQQQEGEKSLTQHHSTAGYTAMAAHKAGSHPVNISEQKNITAERALNCFPCLSPRDSILLF